MRRMLSNLSVLCGLLLGGNSYLMAQPAPKTATVDYDLSVDQKSTPPLLRVKVTFDVPKESLKGGASVAVQMPVWSPGDYSIQKFGQYVRDVVAYDANVPPKNRVPIRSMRHDDANTWTIDPRGATRMTVVYTMPETPPGNFSENVELREKYAFVNGASALMYLVGHKTDPTLLHVNLPEGWQAEAPLPRQVGAGFTEFTAPDYDTLADSPLVMAAKEAIRIVPFTLSAYPKTTYRQVYFGEPKRIQALASIQENTQMLEKVAGAETKLMGGPTSLFYDFFFEIGGRGGALEHLNSCRVPLWSARIPPAFVAHEFFHQWNVKRIRPKVLGPFDYVNPPRTRNLWFAEGVTDYYAYVAIRRAGLISEQAFYSHWRQSIAQMLRNPARLKVTADQASLGVWDTESSQGSGGLSYYEKGALIGLCLDLKIRHLTQNRRSLDDVMRELFARTNFPRPGYDEDDLRSVINSVSGQDLTAFYNQLARSTEEMPFEECLRYAGIGMNGMPLSDTTSEQVALRRAWIGE